MRSLFRLFFIFILLCSFSPVFSQNQIEAKINLRFSVDSRFGSVKGIFKKASLMVKDLKAKTGIIEVKVSSLDTDNTMRDNHLRNEDFFDTEKFPKAEFEILKFEEFGQGVLKGKGKLTIKGIEKEYDFQVAVSNSEESEKYSGSIKINRRDFGINYDSTLNPISDLVNLEFTVIIPIKK